MYSKYSPFADVVPGVKKSVDQIAKEQSWIFGTPFLVDTEVVDGVVVWRLLRYVESIDNYVGVTSGRVSLVEVVEGGLESVVVAAEEARVVFAGVPSGEEYRLVTVSVPVFGQRFDIA